ncbi:MAG: DUF3667 domain-containing protein [Chitinophagaceae bacterium]
MHLLRHFFEDLTHFDGKFFHSLKYLFTKPGFLPKEYLKGRRATYLNPVRMYFFTSAFFFLLFFSFLHKEASFTVDTTINGKTLVSIDNMDSASFARFTADINKEENRPAVPMTRVEFNHYRDSVVPVGGIHFTGRRYNSRAQYDSVLASGVKKHNWIERKLIYKEIDLNEKYHNDDKQIIHAFANALLHSIPQILFISLPILALFFKLLYIRRKDFYYVSHAIFCIYLYIFLFLGLTVIFSLSKLNDALHSGILKFLIATTIIGLFVYEYAAMYKFYGQGKFKTFIKFFLINILLGVLIGILFVVYMFFSLFNI